VSICSTYPAANPASTLKTRRRRTLHYSHDRENSAVHVRFILSLDQDDKLFVADEKKPTEAG